MSATSSRVRRAGSSVLGRALEKDGSASVVLPSSYWDLTRLKRAPFLSDLLPRDPGGWSLMRQAALSSSEQHWLTAQASLSRELIINMDFGNSILRLHNLSSNSIITLLYHKHVITWLNRNLRKSPLSISCLNVTIINLLPKLKHIFLQTETKLLEL